MLHLADHAARRRIVRQFLDAADLVQPEPDQGLALRMMAPLRAAGLLDLDGLCVAMSSLWLCLRCERLDSIRRHFAVDAGAPRLQGGDLDVAPLRDRARRILMLQRIEGRAHHVVRVGRADRLRHHVLHAERVEHRAHRAARDDAGAGRCGAQEHLAGAVTARTS